MAKAKKPRPKGVQPLPPEDGFETVCGAVAQSSQIISLLAQLAHITKNPVYLYHARDQANQTGTFLTGVIARAEEQEAAKQPDAALTYIGPDKTSE